MELAFGLGNDDGGCGSGAGSGGYVEAFARCGSAAQLDGRTEVGLLAKAMACLLGVRRTLRVAAVCAVAAELAIRAAAKAV